MAAILPCGATVQVMKRQGVLTFPLARQAPGRAQPSL